MPKIKQPLSFRGHAVKKMRNCPYCPWSQISNAAVFANHIRYSHPDKRRSVTGKGHKTEVVRNLIPAPTTLDQLLDNPEVSSGVIDERIERERAFIQASEVAAAQARRRIDRLTRLRNLVEDREPEQLPERATGT